MANDYKPMKIKLLDVDKAVRNDHLVRIKSTKKLDANNTLYDEGLFSEKIFGRVGSIDRMTREAYIELNCHCIQPPICIYLERSSTDFTNTMLGIQRWTVTSSGKIEKCKDETGETGLHFIYNNFEVFINKILEDNGSKSRKELLKLLKSYNKNEIFVSKWLVLPAGFRDINSIDIEVRGKSDYDQINDFYTSMINLSNQLENISDVGSSLVDSRFTYQMQQNINSIYRYLMEKKTAKKGGLIQKSGLAKTISYSAGNVICNPKMSRNAYDEDLSTTIPFGHLGINTVHLLDIFYPFVLHRMKEIFEYKEELNSIVKYLVGAKEHHTLNDVIEKFVNKAKNDMKFSFKLMEDKSGNKYDIQLESGPRTLKVIEFLKNEIIDPIIIDKFVTGTRFPVDNKLSQQYLKPIATTVEKVKKYNTTDGLTYELCENEILILAFQVQTSSLHPFGGDFDR